MSPNMTCDASHTVSPRLTVAKRKEALELRKTMKPLMEKRRRARINDSLNNLKNLIFPLTGRDKTHYSKLEKADILEMTVRFLRDIPPVATKSSSDSYKDGYKACLQRVSALLPNTSMSKDVCRQLNSFIQQSGSAPAVPTCLNCCAQNARGFPQVQQTLRALRSSLSPKVEKQRPCGISSGVAQSRGPVAPLGVTSAMWRPW